MPSSTILQPMVQSVLKCLTFPLRCHWSVVPLALALCIAGGSLHAGTIYKDEFTGPAKPVTLDGFSPTERPNNEQWVASPTLYANGKPDTTMSLAWLPATLQNDQTYTLSIHADIVYSAPSLNVTGIAFTTTTSSFRESAKDEKSLFIKKPNIADNVGVLEIRKNGSWSFNGIGNDSGIAGEGNKTLFSTSPTNYEIKLVLTTSSTGPWKLDGYLGGIQRDLNPDDSESMSYVFPTVPAITGVGFYISSGTNQMNAFEFDGPVTPSVVTTESRVLDVFFLAGQSNASGRVSTGYAPDPRDAQVLYYYQTDGPSTNDVTSGGQFLTLQPLESGYYGPEISLGRDLVSLGYHPAIIKVSDGGTDLYQQWNSRSYPPILPPEAKPVDPFTSGLLWKNWLSSTTDALRKLRAMGYVVKVRGFLWLQGESDAGYPIKAINYQNNFEALLDDVRTKLTDEGCDLSDLRFVTALIRQKPTEPATVRDAQKTVMESIPGGRGYWFDNEDLTMLSDNIHFDAPSIATIGHRFAIPFPPQPGYTDWADDNNLSGNDALPDADPDGNGIGNLAEYALGIEPGTAGSALLPSPSIHADMLSFEFPVLQNDVIYQPEWSVDLNTWNTDNITVIRTGVTAKASLPMTSHDRLFMRLKISQTQP